MKTSKFTDSQIMSILKMDMDVYVVQVIHFFQIDENDLIGFQGNA